jgi:hypothetical protein
MVSQLHWKIYVRLPWSLGWKPTLPSTSINYVCVLMFPVNFLTPWTAPVNVVQHLHLDVVLRNRRNRWVSIPTFLSGPAVQCIDFYGYPILIHFVFGIHFWSWISQQFTLKNRKNICGFFVGSEFLTNTQKMACSFDAAPELLWNTISFFLAVPVSVPYKKSVKNISWIGTDQNCSTAEAV